MSNDNHLRIGKKGKDPLTETTEAGHQLFQRLNSTSKDFPYEAVVNAAGNLLLNVLRQRNESRDAALKDFDEMFGRLKSILALHYDAVNGKRRSVFPHQQTIHMPTVSLRNKN